MEARRMRAADLFAKGVSQADIGRELEVSHQTVSDWHEKWAVGGKQALKSTGPTRSSTQGERGRPDQGGPGPGKGTQGQWVPDRVCGRSPEWPT
jgi:transposase-like protein